MSLAMRPIHITVNSRLSTTLKTHAIQAKHTSVVETPLVMTLAQWWQQWRESCLIRGELPQEALLTKVLNSFESLWLWEQVLQQTMESREQGGEEFDPLDETPRVNQSIALLNVSSTAKWLQQAWALSQEWLPASWLDSPYLSDEAQLFKQCQTRYQQALKQRGWLDEVLAQQQWLNWLEQGKGSLPQQFILHGFDDVSPFMQQWQRIVEARGVLCETVSVATIPYPQSAFLYAAQDAQDEVQQIALWCVNQWQALSQTKPASEIKIGVVSPCLADYKTVLTHALDEQLLAQGLQPLQMQRTQPPFYNLSLGVPLSECALVQNALLTVQLFLMPNKSCDYQTWSLWLTSAYTCEDWVQRQQADAAFRQLQWASFCWPTLLETKAAKSLPKALLALLQKEAAQTKESNGSTYSLSGFVTACRAVLQRIGWASSRRLSSDEYQQKQAFEQALTLFSSLTEISGKQSIQAWLSRFKRFLSEQLHQSQSKGLQPIQIMGVLEAGGQQFDALWVMGLTDEAWPRSANPNPFLPMALQREVGAPRCDAKRELTYAQQVTERLASSAPDIVWSYAQHKDDAEQLLSPLIEQMDLQVYAHQPYQSLALQSFQQRGDHAPQWVLDAHAPEIPINQKEESIAPGGTGFLKAQSQCPLMAFMEYRLGAKYGLQAVEEGVQTNKQGILVHRILELFWQETQTQSALLALDDSALMQRLQCHIKQAFDEVFSNVDTPYLRQEQNRLLALCVNWLEMEKQRSSFRVIEIEKQHNIELAGIYFKVVIDRVDKLCEGEEEGGGKIILDYKTGAAKVGDLLKTPNKAPQLAVYLHAMSDSNTEGDSVVGIGYGVLHSDDGVKLNAIVSEEGVLPKLRSITVFAKLAEKEGGAFFETTWEHFLEHLRVQVFELAQQIQQGFAPMVFDKEDDLKYAACLLALRLPEVNVQMQLQEESV